MKILLLDIETAPNRVYVWGLWQQNVALNQIDEVGYTLSWSAKWYGSKTTFFGSILEGKRTMLKRIYDLVDEADVVVHYHGSKFDMPTLNKEWVTLGWTPPAPYAQVDLCNVVKKRFRFPSNKLDYVSKVLGLGSKVNHKGMELWRECMDGDKDAWKTMEAYNRQDVALLEKLYIKLLPWINNHPNHGLFLDSDDMVCPHCGGSHFQRRGFHYTKTMTYQRLRCNDCGSWSRVRITDMTKEKRRAILVGVG